MITKEQIAGFVVVASCCLAEKAAKFVDLKTIGDSTANDELLTIEVINAQLDAIAGYDPVLLTNCLTYDEIIKVIEFIMKKLCICTDLNLLPSVIIP